MRKNAHVAPLLAIVSVLALGVAVAGTWIPWPPTTGLGPTATETRVAAFNPLVYPPAAPPEPSPTHTRVPPTRTHTPLPVPASTATPAPSATPSPTETPVPTELPVPTEPPPPPAPTIEPLTVAAPSFPALYLDVPGYGQEHYLSCEAAAMRMLLSYYGLELAEDEIQATFPLTDNPEIGFRGDVDGSLGFTNYGAHAPAVATALQALLDRSGLAYEATWQSYASREEALAAVYYLLSNDTPVLTWMTWYARNDQAPQTEEVDVPSPVTLVYAEHVEVVYGMEGNLMRVRDPYSYTTQGGRSVRSNPNGFSYTWKNGPPGWQYFQYAVVYLWPRSP